MKTKVSLGAEREDRLSAKKGKVERNDLKIKPSHDSVTEFFFLNGKKKM